MGTSAGGASAVTLHPGDILVAHNDDPAFITRINAAGNETVVSTAGLLTDPWNVILTPKGKIVVADTGSGVVSINPSTGAQAAVSTTTGLTGIGLAPNGNFVASNYDANQIVSVDPATGARTPISTGGSLHAPAQLAVAPNGRIVVAAEGTPVGVFAIDPATGAQTTLASTGLASPYSVALTPAGKVLFVDYDYGTASTGAILAVTNPGGPLRTVSSDQLFQDPIGLARSFRGPLIVAEQDNPNFEGRVISVNPRTGKQTTVAVSNATLGSPGGVFVVPPRCFGRYPTIVGGPAADKLKGTRFADVIVGVGGADKIRGRGGKDRICGGKGRDTLVGGKGRDRLLGGPGKDRARQ
jgi:hypothetical protein